MKTEAFFPQQPHRCAIYFAPRAGSPWWTAGSQWLGRCAVTGELFAQPDVDAVSPELLGQLTAEPRRYGWHATLKAPFVLAPGVTLDDVRVALRGLCAQFPRFTLPPLRAQCMGRFLALRPDAPSPELAAVAAACVTQLHPLAAALSDGDLQRRHRASLTPAQDALLVRWGYPWVLEEFRFHLSLTGDLADQPMPVRDALLAAARSRFESLGPCEFGQVALFVEPSSGADFELLEQVELTA